MLFLWSQDKTNGVPIRDTIGREQMPVLINESGLYFLIMRSRLPSAREFKRWVTSEVLPVIRRTGSYGQPDLTAVISQTVIAVCVEFVRQLTPFFQEAAKMNGQPPEEGCRPRSSETCGNGFIIPDVYGASRCKLETFPEELTMQGG